jgi:hypothetical protein
MRRKSGNLFPFEISILEAAKELLQPGVEGFYGFQIAKAIKDREGKHFLSGYGTLYRSLGRLEKQGFLRSYWEDPQVALEQKRPPRRIYQITGKAVPTPSRSAPESAPLACSWERSRL